MNFDLSIMSTDASIMAIYKMPVLVGPLSTECPSRFLNDEAVVWTGNAPSLKFFVMK